MRSLYLRIWLTVVVALALFALVSGWLVQRHIDEQRERVRATVTDRTAAWAELLQRSLPPADAPPAEQAAALDEWAMRLRLPMALDDAAGQRIATTGPFQRLGGDEPGGAPRLLRMRLDDGRVLSIVRPPSMRGMRGRGDGPAGARNEGGPTLSPWWALPGLPGLPEGAGLAILLALLFAAVAAGAWPVVRRLTRRLEALKQGVEAFGAGALDQRVAEDGRDEVAALAISFNRAAGRIETLLRSHQSLLANASHELRSPLARLKMAVALLDETASGAPREALQREIHADIAELDALVEEVLLASRLDGTQHIDRREPVELLPLLAEEAARVGAVAGGDAASAYGDERLLRRALRNLLENAQRYGGGAVEATLRRAGDGRVRIEISDRGPGVPEALRERIFEPFFRLPGHAEREGGVGLGLSLVRQIAQRHGGEVRCEAREGGGSCFVISVPAA